VCVWFTPSIFCCCGTSFRRNRPSDDVLSSLNIFFKKRQPILFKSTKLGGKFPSHSSLKCEPKCVEKRIMVGEFWNLKMLKIVGATLLNSQNCSVALTALPCHWKSVSLFPRWLHFDEDRNTQIGAFIKIDRTNWSPIGEWIWLTISFIFVYSEPAQRQRWNGRPRTLARQPPVPQSRSDCLRLTGPRRRVFPTGNNL